MVQKIRKWVIGHPVTTTIGIGAILSVVIGVVIVSYLNGSDWRAFGDKPLSQITCGEFVGLLFLYYFLQNATTK